MFTGLIEEIGAVKDIVRKGDGFVLTVYAKKVLKDMKRGDSISINGACQTVIDRGETSFSVFMSKITASITTLGTLKGSEKVNLERAMTTESRFGGHILQGHVDGTGRILGITKDSEGSKITISVDPSLARYIVSKGSIAVDGISLTVVEIGSDNFMVYLIPETLSETTLKYRNVDSLVNIEVDILAKYVEKMLSPHIQGKESTKDEGLIKKLIEEGYNN